MKYNLILASFCLAFFSSFGQDTSIVYIQKLDSFQLLDPVEVRSVRAGELAPFTRTNLSKQYVRENNLGQDIPFLLNQVSSVVINSDAGNGIGYTGIRIRGSDATRINITLNGIPYNDAESQGSFFVDLPDFSSSVNSIQVQRGAGTSSNGAGAFGASIHFSTNELNKDHYAEIDNSVGSFNTWKTTIKAGTGLLADRFTADLRLSRISSNGFIDRSNSVLKSWYGSIAMINGKSNFRVNIFSGHEKTGQAWYGISEADLLSGKRTINYAGTEKPGEPYKNEIDNYKQDHYQLFYDQQITERIQFNTALFLTHGEGFYEQYKADQSYSEYGINSVNNSDFIRQLWLSNDYYGGIYSLRYTNKNFRSDLGGAITNYDGNHFGDLTWASGGLPVPRYRWYDLDAFKKDLTVYSKNQFGFSRYWYLFADLQYRKVDYDINGFRNNPALVINPRFEFINPKLGLTFLKNSYKSYFSFSVARKEPNRDDFEAGVQPLPENLYDIELGLERKSEKFSWTANVYYMLYRNQLVLTGQINDVGAYTRTNVSRSFRTGIEIEVASKPAKWIEFSGNIALSRNRILNFTEYIDDYDNGGQKTINYKNPAIAFSPALVGGSVVKLIPVKDMNIDFINKYVSRQYLDNTEQISRSLDPFFVQDLRLSQKINPKWIKEARLIVHLNNLFNNKYEPNGYTYNYIYGGELSVNNFYFPMAGRNFIIALNLSL